VVVTALTTVANAEHQMARERCRRLPEVWERNDPDSPLPPGDSESKVKEFDYTIVSESMALQCMEFMLSMVFYL